MISLVKLISIYRVGYMTFLVVEDEKRRRKGCVYVRRKGVVEFVINRRDGLGRNQAEIRPQWCQQSPPRYII
jgi:hypothetical protein